MTTRQRYIVWAWIGLVVAASLCPPWHRANDPRGYHTIFAPPDYGTVDLSRLCLEWVAITAVCAGLYFAWPGRKVRTPADPAASPTGVPEPGKRLRAAAARVASIPDEQIPAAMVGDIGHLLLEIEGQNGIEEDAFDTAAELAKDAEWENWRRYIRAVLKEATDVMPTTTLPPPDTPRRWRLPKLRLSRRTKIGLASIATVAACVCACRCHGSMICVGR